jgi:hypothetical protein
MKSRLLVLVLFLMMMPDRGLLLSATNDSIRDIPEARASLRRTVNAKLYRSLLVSPVETWIVVRGELAQDHLIGPRVVRSDLGGKYDSLALELANNLRILDYTRTERSNGAKGILVNLLIYDIADGKMALSFAYFPESGASQQRYSGAAWVAVSKGENWVPIKPPNLSPGERRGPRSYTLAVGAPGSLSGINGNGRLPTVGMSIQGGQAAPQHTDRVR